MEKNHCQNYNLYIEKNGNNPEFKGSSPQFIRQLKIPFISFVLSTFYP
jgi:hypothetical protein